MTTSYSLHLTRHESGQERESTIAQLITEEPALMAATLRAAADRLDPPRPVYREATRGFTATREALERAARRPTATLADEPDPAVLSTTGNAYDASCQGNACNEGHTYLAGCALAPGEPLARQITAKPHGAWACRMGGQPHAGTCDEPRPLDTPPQACPRIAHESGVVIACRVEHAVDHTGRRKFDGALHGNNEHMAIWADDDERIIDRE